jgi:hypothetical protein
VAEKEADEETFTAEDQDVAKEEKPGIRIVKLTVSGSISHNETKRLIFEKLDNIHRCLRPQMIASSDSPRKIAVKLTVDPTGRVSKVLFHQRLVPGWEQCFRDYFKKLIMKAGPGKVEVVLLIHG